MMALSLEELSKNKKQRDFIELRESDQRARPWQNLKERREKKTWRSGLRKTPSPISLNEQAEETTSLTTAVMATLPRDNRAYKTEQGTWWQFVGHLMKIFF